MYSVKPIGINIKDIDREVQDGSLLESINMQWRDGSFKVIPERLLSDITAYQYTTIIFHKVGDENQINVIGFNKYGTSQYLAFDIPEYLGGSLNGNNKLYWFGTILNGDYTSGTLVDIGVTQTVGMSFTISNGLIYFMGDGSSEEEQFYLKIEFDEATSTYKAYDMYKWKTLIPFYPYQDDISLLAPINTYMAFSQCGIVLIRFAVVLKSGEVVLHSPIYGNLLYGINRSDAAFAKGDTVDNIHTFVNLDLSFLDSDLFDEEVSAINVYASTADYESKFLQAYSGTYNEAYLINKSDIRGKMSKKAEEPFYLVKTINAPTSSEKLMLSVGSIDSDIELPAGVSYDYSKVDISSIAAGEIMPVDNFTYHKLYGKITSYNGRLVVKRPTTVLSGGHIRALAVTASTSDEAFSIITEDGTIVGISYAIDRAVEFADTAVSTRGILSYPDIRANLIGVNDLTGADIRMFKCRKNTGHNMSCNFDIIKAEEGSVSFAVSSDPGKLESKTNYSIYTTYDNTINPDGSGLVVYNVPTELMDTTVEVANVIDLTKETTVITRKYLPDVDKYISYRYASDEYTVDNTGTGGVGKFVLSFAPEIMLRITYTSLGVPIVPDTTIVIPSETDAKVKYSSENRIQFSQAGEFKVWPALNSYRIGEGKVMSLGIGSVSPSESQVISPIIIGTTDGTYTINLDPMGNNFIASITKTKNIPFISEEILEIDNNILFVSDRGLMVFSNGDIQNLTAGFFPQQGNGGFPASDSIFFGYNLLTSEFLGGMGNPYQLDDIVTYMRGALLAYDSRRRNIWCCNPTYNFSLVYNLDVAQWCMSTTVFTQKMDFFSILNTPEGELYTQYMIKLVGNNTLAILSGEDPDKEVFYHILTRPIKSQYVDDYKVLSRAMIRTLLVRSGSTGYVYLGLWGQQDIDRNKKSIPIAIKKDNRNSVFPNNIRYHLPINCRKGKYKSLTILQGGKALPESYISSFDLDISLVDNKKLR